ncbi:MAG: hypothetical protein AB7O57_09725 [Hyphomicrobiaceae bacterium]
MTDERTAAGHASHRGIGYLFPRALAVAVLAWLVIASVLDASGGQSDEMALVALGIMAVAAIAIALAVPELLEPFGAPDVSGEATGMPTIRPLVGQPRRAPRIVVTALPERCWHCGHSPVPVVLRRPPRIIASPPSRRALVRLVEPARPRYAASRGRSPRIVHRH